MKVKRKLSYKLNQTLHHAYNLIGKDSVSGAKITSRQDLEEIGTKYGGWVVPTSAINSTSICYLAGCGEDISFDLGLIEQFACEVYGFDPTPRAIAHVKKIAGNNPKYHFHDIGLWDKEDMLKFYVPKDPNHVSHSLVNLQNTNDYISVKVDRLSNIMSELGHQKIDLLKIDIEGAEYKVIDTIIEDNIDINVICIEYDEFFNPLDHNWKNRIRESINRLIKVSDFSLVHAQGSGNYTFMKNS